MEIKLPRPAVHERPQYNCVVAMAKILAALLLFSPVVISDLLGLPTVPFIEDGGHLNLSNLGRIIVDVEHCDSTDTAGHTLIPPTLLEFANTFASDLEATGCHTEVVAGDQVEADSIFLTIGNSSEFVDAAGRWTAEAYTLNVTDDRIIITGASALGAWWATRSVFQQKALNGTIATGYGVDAPGWGTRGIMVRLLLS
jgi:hexosaminidase